MNIVSKTVKNELFERTISSGEIFLIYSAADSALPAKDLGMAIVGMEACLRETARFANLIYQDVYVLSLEDGSLKTKFLFIKNHPIEVVVALDLAANLLTNSLSLIDRFGANNFRNPSTEILKAVNDKKILQLCQSYEFRKGAQRVAEPLNEEYNQKVEIIVDKNKFEIKCENKYNFYVDRENEKILPELKNGDTAELRGEITRINKTNNDLGFKYKDRILVVIPIDENKSTSAFHQYLEMNDVILKGLVVRDSEYITPKIKVIDIHEATSQAKLFDK